MSDSELFCLLCFDALVSQIVVQMFIEENFILKGLFFLQLNQWFLCICLVFVLFMIFNILTFCLLLSKQNHKLWVVFNFPFWCFIHKRQTVCISDAVLLSLQPPHDTGCEGVSINYASAGFSSPARVVILWHSYISVLSSTGWRKGKGKTAAFFLSYIHPSVCFTKNVILMAD